jgi:DNA-directed RNA polymerase specialized sigma24 family protein
MPDLAPGTLATARDYKRSAVTALLESYAPLVHRLAWSLCGDAAVGDAVTTTVLRRAIRVLPRWRDDAEADRWFYHYTVLETRRAPLMQAAAPDPLVSASPRNDAPYLALARALRALPVQQREAILLHHGEHLNPRYLAVAMDCSAEAAANHLRVATLQLRQLFGDGVDAMLNDIAIAYQRIAPNTQALHPEIRRQISRFLIPRRLGRITFAVLLIVFAVLIWYARANLVQLWHSLRSIAT